MTDQLSYCPLPHHGHFGEIAKRALLTVYHVLLTRRIWVCRSILVNGAKFNTSLAGWAHPGSAPAFFFERCRLQFLDTLRLMMFHFLFSLLMSASIAVHHQNTGASVVARPCAE